jgi:hypothetical protein
MNFNSKSCYITLSGQLKKEIIYEFFGNYPYVKTSQEKESAGKGQERTKLK